MLSTALSVLFQLDENWQLLVKSVDRIQADRIRPGVVAIQEELKMDNDGRVILPLLIFNSS